MCLTPFMKENNNGIIGKADDKTNNNINGSLVYFTNSFITKYVISLLMDDDKLHLISPYGDGPESGRNNNNKRLLNLKQFQRQERPLGRKTKWLKKSVS